MSVQNKYPFYLSTVIGAILIGLAPILMRYSEVSPSMTGFYRFFSAFLILLIYGAIKGKKFFVNTNLYILALPGIFFGADIALWHTAIMITPVTNAALLVNTAPIYVGIISFLFFKERISKLFLISLILSFIGVSLIILNLQNFDVFLGKNLRGDLLSLLAAIFYAGYLVSVRRLSSNLDTFQLMLYSALFGCIPLLALGFFETGIKFPISLQGAGNLLLQSTLVQIIGQGLVIYGLSQISAQFTSLILLLQVLTAAILSMFLFNELLLFQQILGGIILIIGIYIAGLNERKSNHDKK
jgi:drug/metabolite transporter (DMT)-like permease